jgi:hypothetical protein
VATYCTIARFKAHRRDGKQIRLLEFTAAFVEPDWCEKGHIGIVLEGAIELDFHGDWSPTGRVMDCSSRRALAVVTRPVR